MDMEDHEMEYDMEDDEMGSQYAEQLRLDLQGHPVNAQGPATQGLAALDTQLSELMYAWSPTGGYYRRHCVPQRARSFRQYRPQRDGSVVGAWGATLQWFGRPR